MWEVMSSHQSICKAAVCLSRFKYDANMPHHTRSVRKPVFSKLKCTHRDKLTPLSNRKVQVPNVGFKVLWEQTKPPPIVLLTILATTPVSMPTSK